MKKRNGISSFGILFGILLLVCMGRVFAVTPEEFLSPPDSARPWVYLFIMDGNLTAEGITADLEAMKEQGIGGFIMMEVNVGVPRGTVDFMSEQWQKLFAHLVRESERLGLQMALSSGPGWAGSGGPWITPEKSMWHLVASEKIVKGPTEFNEALPNPVPRKPFFGEGQLPPDIEKARKEFFKDVRVLAFRKPEGTVRVKDIDEKALYVRAPYSSVAGVKPYIPAPAEFESVLPESVITSSEMLDLSDKLDASGTLKWSVPDGEWTILRFAATSTGANTRPAPAPALGLESSKMDKEAFDLHAENFILKLFDVVGERRTDGKAGWCFFHLDSWEMGPQNYSDAFFEEFKKRRGYDPLPFLPAYLGFVVESNEKTERFLWDVRQTAQELVIENYGLHLKEFAHKNNLKLSIEPYDMMPCCNMTFGAIADVPMCEFWRWPYDTAFSCFEAASTAHTNGRTVVSAEAFTSLGDAWRENPKNMKQRGDWAFCSGVNRFTFHRYQHQPYMDKFPGFSMGGIGVHWERTQTWWPLISGYHKYLARCQHVLQQGVAVVDILYLLPEGAPQVFTPPKSSLIISDLIKDQRGYRFDACEPVTFRNLASVEDGKIAFPNGTKYRILVLPETETMTLPMLEKIESLLEAGAIVIGHAPKKSPSLQDYPKTDESIRELSAKMWGEPNRSKTMVIPYGKGKIVSLKKDTVTEKPITLDEAKWVWYPEGNPAHDAPAGSRFFRKTLDIPVGESIQSARILGIADNDMIVKVNGIEVHKASLHSPLQMNRFEKSLKTGENLIEIEAINGENDQRNPAGLIARFEIVFVSENSEKDTFLSISTDETWETSKDNQNWEKALVLGNFGMQPWNIANSVGEQETSLYPEYEQTAEILIKQGISEDCDSTEKGLRFFHRQDGDADYYFLGNRTEKHFHGDVSFRIIGKKVSIWDPMTGRIFRAPPVKTENGQTILSLDLEGSQSVFVVFTEKEIAPADAPVWKALPQNVLVDISQDWEVTFDPARGGPKDPVRFEKLPDWTSSELDEIKFYSGIAVYRKTFNVSDIDFEPEKRHWLDLGNVEVMARVKLNGKDIGTRWIAPYKFEITGQVRKGENRLEIETANLWSNRLIGDAGKPLDVRTSWTTFWSSYNSDSPLMPSGLIGPVRVLEE